MSQFKILPYGSGFQRPTDWFSTVVVASTAGFLVGEKVTAGAVTAKVSRIYSATKLIVKGMKGDIEMTGTLVGATSGASSVISTPSTFGYPRMRDVNGSSTEVMFHENDEDDRGLSLYDNSRNNHKEVVVAVRLAASKTQTSDAAGAPWLTYGLPPDATYADGDTLQFTITSNEALSVVGSPRVAILNAGSLVTTYATYVPEKSSSMFLVFEYTNDDTVSAAGQIVSALYNANGAVITDIGGSAVVPSSFGTVTGIILA